MTALASAAQLTALLGAVVPEAQATALLERASDVLRGVTGRAFDYVEDDVVTLNPSGQVVIVPELPVVDVSAVEVLDPDTPWAPETPVWLTFPDRWVWSATGVIRAVGSRFWPCAPRSVRVTYTHGFELVPSDLANAAVTLAADYALNPANLTAATTGGVSMRFDVSSAALPAAVQAVADRYTMVDAS